MSEIPGAPPERQSSRMQVAWGWYLDHRFKDPAQRASQCHIHDDLTQTAARVRSFLAEDEAVKVQVMMELRYRIERNAAGNAAPALSGILGAVTVAATLLGTLVLAVANGWFGIMIKMTDPETGIVRGITQQQLGSTLGSVAIPLVVIAVVALMVALWAAWHASGKDYRRAVTLSWMEEYSRARVQNAAVDVQIPERGSGSSRLSDRGTGRLRSMLSFGDTFSRSSAQ
ncbi:hypothetical protein E3T61_08985 [Cryobacterium lactosi]|uniref:Uncharacterized protein n=1 Tax=Cryobacterium lactosi TaxID=1259202 RepID=A0A4V3IXN5_9MICO|nr:hypothetical protein [Cryobacterium lactosi]TFD91585.1 hypothetical protein E3T61_08985 [Cryobacterium lactosi]